MTVAQAKDPEEDLVAILVDALTAQNPNFKPSVDVARLDAAETILKYASEHEEAERKALAFLEDCSNGRIPADAVARVRAAKILLQFLGGKL